MRYLEHMLHYFENIKHSIFTYIFIWVGKFDSNSLTKTKNWNGRNEVTETSGVRVAGSTRTPLKPNRTKSPTHNEPRTKRLMW